MTIIIKIIAISKRIFTKKNKKNKKRTKKIPKSNHLLFGSEARSLAPRPILPLSISAQKRVPRLLGGL